MHLLKRLWGHLTAGTSGPTQAAAWRVLGQVAEWTIAGEKQSEVMTGVVFQRYQERLRLGQIEPDAAQGEAVVALDRLASALAGWRPAKPGLFSFLGREKGVRPRGLYLHGGVGRGKTMLMDLFYEAVDFKPKRRSHFHAFMAEAHERIAIARTKVDGDPIPLVALEMAGDPGLLCFDELHVTDIADAMILGRFFKVVFERGVVIVATSNAHPSELYRHGLNRQLFLPFIDLIEEQSRRSRDQGPEGFSAG